MQELRQEQIKNICGPRFRVIAKELNAFIKVPLKTRRNLAAVRFRLVLLGNPIPIDTPAASRVLSHIENRVFTPGQDPQLSTDIFISGIDRRHVIDLLPLAVVECFIPCVTCMRWV